MRKLRVGFPFCPRSNWLGGANYIRNLLFAIVVRRNNKVNPVLISSPEDVDASYVFLRGLENYAKQLSFAVVPFANRFPETSFGEILHEALWGRASYIETVLREHEIDLLSHFEIEGVEADFPFAGWIPDFQHRRRPEFFGSKEIEKRDFIFRRIASKSRLVFLSSQAALSDFQSDFPQYAAKGRVLRFVSYPFEKISSDEAQEIIAAYGIKDDFFYLPNQFWVHKNHSVVIEALSILRQRGRKCRVVATGSAEDYRHPGHYGNLLEKVKVLGVESEFHHLGVVPYRNVAALVKTASAIINPSFFEGWSSTVEEAKAMGQRMLLSDIPVHREQAGGKALYFDPSSPEDLADCICKTLSEDRLFVDEKRQDEIDSLLMERVRDFGNQYEAYVREALKV